MVGCEFERVSDSGDNSPTVHLRLRRNPVCWVMVCSAVVGVALMMLGCARTSSDEFAGEWVIASLLCNERELEGAKGNTVTIDQEWNTLTFVQTMDGREMPERWHYSVNQAIWRLEPPPPCPAPERQYTW